MNPKIIRRYDGEIRSVVIPSDHEVRHLSRDPEHIHYLLIQKTVIDDEEFERRKKAEIEEAKKDAFRPRTTWERFWDSVRKGDSQKEAKERLKELLHSKLLWDYFRHHHSHRLFVGYPEEGLHEAEVHEVRLSSEGLYLLDYSLGDQGGRLLFPKFQKPKVIQPDKTLPLEIVIEKTRKR